MSKRTLSKVLSVVAIIICVVVTFIAFNEMAKDQRETWARLDKIRNEEARKKEWEDTKWAYEGMIKDPKVEQKKNKIDVDHTRMKLYTNSPSDNLTYPLPEKSKKEELLTFDNDNVAHYPYREASKYLPDEPGHNTKKKSAIQAEAIISTYADSKNKDFDIKATWTKGSTMKIHAAVTMDRFKEYCGDHLENCTLHLEIPIKFSAESEE